MAKVFNRAWMTVSGTPGVGTITLGTAFSAAYLTFAEAGVADTNVVSYVLEDGDDFEIGIGTYTSAGTTLSRDTVRISKEGATVGTAKITASSASTVFILPAKEDFIAGFLELADPGADRIAFWDDSATTLTWLSLSGLTITGTSLAVDAASDTAAGVIEVADQTEQEAASATNRAVTPGRQHFHPSAAKCWAQFNSAASVAASYNITSVTDGGTGAWTVNIATDFSSASYAIGQSVENAAAARMMFLGTVTAGTIPIRVVDSSFADADATAMRVDAFGDQ